MALSITCPACRATLRVREDYAGQHMTCPRCSARVPVETEEPVPVDPVDVAVAPVPVTPLADGPAVPTKACPACGKQVAYTARKCRHCRTWIEEDDDDEVGRSYFKPCPRCGGHRARRVIFTFWGSFYGPALFTHVRCPDCRYAYNGRTGRSNLIPAIIFVTIPLMLIVAILGGLAFVIYQTMMR